MELFYPFFRNQNLRNLCSAKKQQALAAYLIVIFFRAMKSAIELDHIHPFELKIFESMIFCKKNNLSLVSEKKTIKKKLKKEVIKKQA